MPNHIERRRNLWYATLTIPVDVRGKLGKAKFVKSLGTPDRRTALAIAAPILAGWRAIIRRERGETDAVIAEALRWRTALAHEENTFQPAEGLEDSDTPILDSLAVERAEELEAKHGLPVARRFMDIALGVTIPSSTHFEPWMAAQAHLKKKTQDQMRKDVALLVARFPTLGGITHQAIKGWLDEMTSKRVSPSSQKRIVSFCRSYWRHLQSVDAVPSEINPFNNLAGIVKGQRRATQKASWTPLLPEDVVKLYEAAQAEGDGALADLIMLGAYTGARIEELCALKVKDVNDTSFKIIDAKTQAGIREVPLHPRIRPLVKRLKTNTKDGYLLTGLTFNKYGFRSGAIGQRFGRLKARLDFGGQQVFHSIRKTLVTLLEDAGVSENLAADIVGHKKKNITFGLYSGGHSLTTKAEALERIKYPKWPAHKDVMQASS